MACSSDDSSTQAGTDSGTDTAADNYVPPKDSGPKDSGGGADACSTCGVAWSTIGAPPPCTDNGTPSSADLTDELYLCTCPDDGGGICNTPALCGGATGICGTGEDWPTSCQNCQQTNCEPIWDECFADDGGFHTPPDAGGDGGDGG